MIVFLIPIIGVLCFAFLAYSIIKGRHAERMSMIEKGLDATEMKFGTNAKWVALRIGMLLIGLGIGFVIGSALNGEMFFRSGAMSGLAFLFGGIALVLNFWIENKLRKNP